MTSSARPSRLLYLLTALFALTAAVAFWEGDDLSAGSSLLLAAAMGIVAARGGQPGPRQSIVVWALFAASLGVSIYGWMT